MENFWTEFVDWMKNAYRFVVNHVPVEVLIYIGIALLVLILAAMISRIVKRRKVEKRLSQLEIDINEIRNNSLQYKFNKAVAFAEANSDLSQRVSSLEPKYKVCMDSISACENLYEKAYDQLSRHKYKKSMRTMDEVETVMEDTEKRIHIVDASLDKILSREAEVREKANRLMERYRAVKNQYINNKEAFSTGQDYMDSQIAEIETALNAFEEKMYASQFNQAREDMDHIAGWTEELEQYVQAYPALYQTVNTDLPKALEEARSAAAAMEADKIDISYLNVEEKLEAISNALKDAVVKLDNGNIKKGIPAVDAVTDQILALQDDIAQEHKAFDEIHSNLETNFAVVDEVEKELSEITSLYASIKDRFGLEDWTRRFARAREQMEILKVQRDEIRSQLSQEDVLQVDVVSGYRAFSQRIEAFGTEVREMKRLLVGASSDESRARKQVTKLQLILNEVRLNTSSRQLPAISGQFDEDLKTGEQKIEQVRTVLNTSPLDVEALNTELQDAIDFIYRLYSNANNLTGVAVMVENAIVFGNRFRSSYPALDSDLTKAEFLFQNGEYTRALKTAIQAIETLHPGIYEKLVARKDPAVMNQA